MANGIQAHTTDNIEDNAHNLIWYLLADVYAIWTNHKKRHYEWSSQACFIHTKAKQEIRPSCIQHEVFTTCITERSSDGRMTPEKGGGEENIPTEDKIL